MMCWKQRRMLPGVLYKLQERVLWVREDTLVGIPHSIYTDISSKEEMKLKKLSYIPDEMC